MHGLTTDKNDSDLTLHYVIHVYNIVAKLCYYLLISWAFVLFSYKHQNLEKLTCYFFLIL